MTIPAYPLQWPAGWKRTTSADRTTARFGKASRAKAGGGWTYGLDLPNAYAMARGGKRDTGRLLDGIEHNAYPEQNHV